MNRLLKTALGLLLSMVCAANAARGVTLSFDDLPPTVFALPSSFQTGGVTVELTDFGPQPGLAQVEPFDPPNQWLRLAISVAASLEVPQGVTHASFYYYNRVSLSSFTVNSAEVSFEGLAGTSGSAGGVAYTVTANPRSSLDRVDLAGPIASLDFTSGPSPNALLLDTIVLIPEPSGWLLAAAGCAVLLTARTLRWCGLVARR